MNYGFKSIKDIYLSSSSDEEELSVIFSGVYKYNEHYYKKISCEYDRLIDQLSYLLSYYTSTRFVKQKNDSFTMKAIKEVVKHYQVKIILHVNEKIIEAGNSQTVIHMEYDDKIYLLIKLTNSRYG